MAATAATATAAALQQAPITFQSRTPSTFRPASATPIKSSFIGGLRLQKLSIKLNRKSRSGNTGGGASGARMTDSAAGSYASALAEVAVGNGTLDATVKDLDVIDKLFSEKAYFDYFASPIVTLEAKRALIDDITSSGKLQKHVCNFLNILIESKRIDLIREIVKEFEVVYNKLTNTELAIVSSVVKLEEQHLSQIAKQVQKLTGAKFVRVKTVIDESLVAGFTIRYGNGGSKLIDMSVKKQLEEIAAQLEIGDISLAV
ncbi:ATP synthase delta chain, chloroplastic [Rutidosis leptorrhynchoides]|uniref:ATP synthase delta chain, chloroplastic n=1 Tax=Rutidosis leptorrhynchoides TaxID=125765 RepID=UPI003A9A4569